jgi:WS/DGAT/MGAT family acyltransferase
MARYNYERLSAQDNSFLLFETPNLHMHVASTQIFELGPLQTEDGGVDYRAIKRLTESVLYRIPLYRQKLRWIAFENTPVWVDDTHFNIDFHVRHAALPKPGSEAQLKKLSARIMAQQLDRTRPLWEIWVVEGLEGDRFALISKIHHCMIDGSSGVDISQILQSLTPDREIHEAPPFIPRPAPTRVQLWRDSVGRRLGLPFQALRNLEEFRRQTEDLRAEIRLRVRALQDMFAAQMTTASETPINGRIGPHRIFDWTTMALADVKAVRKGLGCTVNDVVLTTVTGAFREFMLRRQLRPEDLDFRVQAPVSVRREEERGRMGSRVSAWLVQLPLAESDPLRQLEEIHRTTHDLKESKQALGVDMMMSLMEVMPTGLLSLAAQAASGSMNTIVTNVPGPQFPLYLLGAEMSALFPQVPLLPNVGLGIALISYNGRVCWGFNADAELVPDLGSFVQLVRSSFERVADAAGVKLKPTAARRGTRAKDGKALRQ